MTDSKSWLDNLKADQPSEPGSGIFGITPPLQDAKLVLLPVEWEATTSYGQGTKNGPRAILEASPQLDFYDPCFGEMIEHGIYMEESNPEIQKLNEQASQLAKNVRDVSYLTDQKENWRKEVNRISKQVNKTVYEKASHYLAQNKFVGVVGGDHSSPYGLIKALSEKYSDFSILHFDAHFDLRKKYEGFTWSHASIMYNVLKHIPQVSRICHVGIRDFCASEKELSDTSDRSVAYLDRDIFRSRMLGNLKDVLASMINSLSQNVYVSFDIDGLDPALCPSTGTPVPGGLSFNDASYILEELVLRGKKVIGFDLCEVASKNPQDEWDANVGARVLYKLSSALLYSQFHTAPL